MGSSSRDSTSTTTPVVPDWLSQHQRNYMDTAGNLFNQNMQAGFQPYDPAQRYSPTNQLQQQAVQGITGFQGDWQPFMQSSADALNASNAAITSSLQMPGGPWGMQAAYSGPSAQVQAQNLGGMNLDAYTNPYQQQVTNQALQGIEQTRQQQLMQNNDAATRARAFGGSRHGVVDSLTNQNALRQSADTALQGANQGFLNAQSQATNDINRNLQAQGMNQGAYNQNAQFNAGLAQDANRWNADAGMANRQFGMDAARLYGQNAMNAAQLGGMFQNYGANDYSNLMNAGNFMQDQDQRYRDFGFDQWQAQQQYPWQQLGYYGAAVNGSNVPVGQTNTTPQYRNRGAGFLGGAQAGYGMTNNGWGALIGGLLGAYG